MNFIKKFTVCTVSMLLICFAASSAVFAASPEDDSAPVESASSSCAPLPSPSSAPEPPVTTPAPESPGEEILPVPPEDSIPAPAAPGSTGDDVVETPAPSSVPVEEVEPAPLPPVDEEPPVPLPLSEEPAVDGTPEQANDVILGTIAPSSDVELPTNLTADNNLAQETKREEDIPPVNPNWIVKDGKRYYRDPTTKKRLIGYHLIDGEYYYFDPKLKGAARKGFVDIADVGRVFFNFENKAVRGWFIRNGKTYYARGKDAKLLSGLVTISGKRYYLDPDKKGTMRKGFVTIGTYGTLFFNAKDGYAEGGWFTRLGKQYYAHPKTNKIYTGLHKISNEYYYFNPAKKGAAQKGFVNIEGVGHMYFSGKYNALRGWITRGKNKFYARGKDALILNGLVKVSGNRYYLDPKLKGAMRKGFVQINPLSRYFFNVKNGTAASGWFTRLGKKYYADLKSNKLFIGLHVIDSKAYVFDKLGRFLKNGVPSKYTGKNSHGIDVSAHQGLIDWAQVKASGKVTFAIIRALHWNTAANYYGIDPYFDANVRGAKAHGIMVGVYLFSYAFNNTEMAEEINFFVNHPIVKQHKKEKITYDLPVYIDYEYTGILKNNPTFAGRTNTLRHGMELLDQKGYVPGFYASYSWGTQHFDAATLQRDGYDFWMARFYNNVPDKGPAQHGWTGLPLTMWQYCSNGSIPGIAGRVDINHCYKTYKFYPIGTTRSSSATVTSQNTQQSLTATIVNPVVTNQIASASNTRTLKAQTVVTRSLLPNNSYLSTFSNSNVSNSVSPLNATQQRSNPSSNMPTNTAAAKCYTNALPYPIAKKEELAC